MKEHLSSQIRLYDLYIDLIYFIECYSGKYDRDDGQLEWASGNLLEVWKRFTNKR